MMENKYDASIPREMFWADEIPNSNLCPACNAKLEKEFHTYVLLMRKGKDRKSFLSGNDGGSFCPNCNVVVLDRNVFAAHISHATRHAAPLQFTVAGIVDLYAIPDDKKGAPLGGDDNPIPLVKFKKHAKWNCVLPASEKPKKIRKFLRQQRKKTKRKNRKKR